MKTLFDELNTSREQKVEEKLMVRDEKENRRWKGNWMLGAKLENFLRGWQRRTPLNAKAFTYTQLYTSHEQSLMISFYYYYLFCFYVERERRGGGGKRRRLSLGFLSRVFNRRILNRGEEKISVWDYSKQKVVAKHK